jgi:undecaprenyl diphosphate synthase
MNLILALSYGGRAEIVRMVQEVAEKIKRGIIDSQAVNEGLISDHLYTRDIPDPDLLIRTSGEMRISNFLLWQIAYTELFVTTTLWPDFSKEELLQILKDFQTRVRRFGAL